MRIRKKYEREREALDEFDKTQTVQDDGSTDINVIVDRFQRTGKLPDGKTPIYADVSELQNKNLIELLQKKEQVDNLVAEAQLKAAAEEQERLKAAAEEQESVERQEEPLQAPIESDAVTPTE